MAYTDADEDAERLLSFGDTSAPGDGDEWVETHAGRQSHSDSIANATVIQDIPDLDASADLTTGIDNMHIHSTSAPGEIPNLDDIPDMEEDDLEAGDEATAAPKTLPVQTAGDVRSVLRQNPHSHPYKYHLAKTKLPIYYKYELTML